MPAPIKKARTKSKRRRRLPSSPCSRFWVIDTSGSGESTGTKEARGPFSSRKAAEDWIRNDTRQSWEDSCDCLRRSDGWDAPMIVLEEVAAYRPEIDWTVKVRLRSTDNT